MVLNEAKTTAPKMAAHNVLYTNQNLQFYFLT